MRRAEIAIHQEVPKSPDLVLPAYRAIFIECSRLQFIERIRKHCDLTLPTEPSLPISQALVPHGHLEFEVRPKLRVA